MVIVQVKLSPRGSSAGHLTEINSNCCRYHVAGIMLQVQCCRYHHTHKHVLKITTKRVCVQLRKR